MAWTDLITAIEAAITTNGNEEITGTVLRELLVNNIVPQLGAAKFQGTAVPSTDPGTPQKEVFYFAEENGTYANFAGLQVNNELAVFRYTTTWEKVSIMKLGMEASATKDMLTTLFEQIQANFWSVYNGSTSTTTLASTYTLQNAGDSVEFDFSYDDNTDQSAMGIMGELGGTTSHIGFWENKLLYIRDIGGDWLSTNAFNGTTQPNEVHKCKLLWVDGGIEVYKDDVLKATIPNGTLRISNIGNSYANFAGKVKNITINSGGVEIKVASPYFEENNTDVTLESASDAYLTPAQIATLLSVTNNTEVINSLIAFYRQDESYYTRYNGSTSETVLAETYTLAADGDYVEVVMRLWDGIVTFNDGLGAFGVRGVNSNTFGFYDIDSVWFRGDGDAAYTQVNGLTGFEAFAKYKLLVISGGTEWEVFKDDVSVGTFPKTNDFKVNNVGFGYTAGAKIDIKSFKVHTATEDLTIPNLYFSELTDTDLELKQEVTADVTTFAECYLTFQPTGSSGNKKFIAYVQNKANKKYYYGFEVAHEINTAELVYMNQYRLQRANVYEYNGEVMISTGEVALTQGESEYVYQTAGKVDFTGGYHGDEQLVEVNFYIDGVRLTDLTTAFELKACSSFEYIQKSTMHETAATGDVVNPAHPIEAEHFKHTRFNNSGYWTASRVIGKKVGGLPMTVNYGSIVCVSREYGGQGQTDRYAIETFDTGGGHKLNEVNDNVHTWNETNNTSARVTSKFSVRNDQSYQFIWDTVTYNKYYRDTTRTTGGSSIGHTLAENEEWYFETETIFNKQ